MTQRSLQNVSLIIRLVRGLRHRPFGSLALSRLHIFLKRSNYRLLIASFFARDLDFGCVLP